MLFCVVSCSLSAQRAEYQTVIFYFFEHIAYTVRTQSAGGAYERQRIKKAQPRRSFELLLDERRENERLQLKLKETEEKLSERTIAIDEAGSIAQAVMQLNGVFKVAEAAVSQYVENVQRLQTEKEAKFWQMEIEAKERAENIIEEAQAYSRRVHSETDKYQTLLAEKLKAMLTEYESRDVPPVTNEQEHKA